jgi:para-nitrobenzyl esterase
MKRSSARLFRLIPLQLSKAYPAKDEASVRRALVDLMRDMSVGRQMFLWATDNTRYGKSSTYGYFFSRRQPYADGITFSDHDPATVGAYHTGEVPYFLRSLDSLNLFRHTRNWTHEDFALSDTMSGAILTFARTGNPGPKWKAFDPKKPKLMQLDFESGLIDWPNAKSLKLLQKATIDPVRRENARVRD